MEEMDAKHKIGVIIPAYNEANNLEKMVVSIHSILDQLSLNHTICVVDDGSSDNTWKIIEDLHAKHPVFLEGLRFSRNFGKDSGVIAGLSKVQADCYLVIDADGQHPAELIPKFIEKWQLGNYDVIDGVKVDHIDEPSSSKSKQDFSFGKVFHYLFSKLSKLDLNGSCDYKLLSRRVVVEILKLGDYHLFFRAMTNWVGFRHVDLPFQVEVRWGGRSKWSFTSLLKFAVNAVIIYSSVPLYTILSIGVISILFSFVFAFKLLVQYFFWQSVLDDFSILLAALLILFSIIMTAIGVLGLYLNNAVNQVLRRPTYIVMDELKSSG